MRRIYIEKKHSKGKPQRKSQGKAISKKKRPLGIPAWSDKLLAEVIRLILEAYYEPQFSPSSHGFRPDRGCHTALREIYHKWVGTKWFVEGDISDCFGSLDHTIMMSILREKLHDNRFLRLIEGLLKAGYLEGWRYNATLSGSAQGSVLSPILANIYLAKLDKYVETTLLSTYNQGNRRKINPEYLRLRASVTRLKRMGKKEQAHKLRRQMQQLPSLDPNDPAYRRLRYIRYADDVLVGFSGPRKEAEEIKQLLKEFLGDELKLTLSEEKTLITHARSKAARFLGYEVVVLNNDHKLDRRGHRSINGQIGLKVPSDVVRAKSTGYLHNGKPIHRTELIHDSVYSIMAQYQAEYRGIVEYYRLAYNLHQLNRLRWVMERSLTQTLAHKLRISVSKIYHRYQTNIQTEAGPRVGLQVAVERGEGKKPLIAKWGGITLARNMKAVLNDQPTRVWGSHSHTELEKRFLADTCELCGSREDVEVHHIRALKDLKRKGRADRPEWVKVMAARQRKTLVVCRACHDEIHRGKLTQHTLPRVQHEAANGNGEALESRVLRKA